MEEWLEWTVNKRGKIWMDYRYGQKGYFFKYLGFLRQISF